MKKLLIGLAIASALGLSGCDDETISDIEKENNEATATGPDSGFTKISRVRFDPSSGDVAPPNDLLFIGTNDGTLDLPLNGGDPADFTDPFVAANALDGWSTNQPFVLNFEFADGVSIEPASLFDIGAVAIYEVVLGASIVDADCAAVPALVGCKPVKELVLTEDYFVQVMGGSLAIIPLKPLKPKTSYIVALTNKLKDTNGNSIDGSPTYNLIKQDVTEFPHSDPDLLGLQQLTNSYENIAEGFGLVKDEIIYTMTMTTQSTVDSSQVTKQLLAASLNPATALFPTPAVTVEATPYSAADILIAGGLIAADDLDLVPLYKSANLYSGSITVPYYSQVPTSADISENTFWNAMCDSGAMLAGAPAEYLASLTPGMYDAACQSFGLRDFRDEQGNPTLDLERNLTKYNPIPKVNAMQELDVQMTEPNVVIANVVREALGIAGELVKPEGGWPIVILQHGITSKKEDMLAITGLLSINGFATVAIDHPLHNSRGFDTDNDSVNEVDAASNPFYYINIANLLNARDNFRQSASDTLALRMGINFLSGDLNAGVDVNPTDVYYVGHSLGAMTGVNFLALTNTSLDEQVDGLFNVKAASLASPAGGVPNFGMESASFGPLIKFNLAASLSPDFAQFAAAQSENPSAEEMAMIWQSFVDNVGVPAELSGAFDLWTFAAQSISDSADMINYSEMLKGNGTPLHVIEMVGNGQEFKSDQVIPVTVSSAPLAGSSAMINLLGVPVVKPVFSEEMPAYYHEGSGAVKFIAGDHSSLLDPTSSVSATFEIQAQVATFFVTQGNAIAVTDGSVVLK
ncbi:hypothetical protein RI845_06870 [Thalassotalea nanhaiensis]|uniref:Bacterial virulence factor lipase N-terminal domain-containing protein n=1 Tax=Thalassotalea nanhaiensis TaxID=3065648 RepID=A0ABY9TLY8_9GAMM|nr:hypothetical protein RI845_06870 [Colwelliaceae bacterium SQ345]